MHIYIYIYIYTCIHIHKYIYMNTNIYSPVPVGLSSPVNEVIVLLLAFITSLFIHIN